MAILEELCTYAWWQGAQKREQETYFIKSSWQKESYLIDNCGIVLTDRKGTALHLEHPPGEWNIELSPL